MTETREALSRDTVAALDYAVSLHRALMSAWAARDGGLLTPADGDLGALEQAWVWAADQAANYLAAPMPRTGEARIDILHECVKVLEAHRGQYDRYVAERML